MVRSAKTRLRIIAPALLIALAAAGGGTVWWWHRPLPLPAGIAFGNGRTEADEVDIDTKFAGRVAEVLVDEGTMVKAGQAVARMDSPGLQAILLKDQALVLQAQTTLANRAAAIEQQRTVVDLPRWSCCEPQR